MNKFRGFEAVQRLREINTKPLYPSRNDARSAGYDFYYPYQEPITVNPGETKIIASGIKAYMQANERLDVNTRSGNGCKKNIVLANTIGWIDASYYNNPDNEGEILVALKNEGKEPFEVKYGDKYCQASFTNYLVADYDYIINKKRVGGLGSSDKEQLQ